jgi:predicted aspartyl protease
VVQAQLGGRDVELIFDTGNMSGLALNREMAEEMNLTVVRETKRYDSAGNVIGSSSVYEVKGLMLLGREWDVQEAVESGIDVGLAGPRFYPKRFTVDYRVGCVAVSATALPADATADVILPLVVSPRYPYLIIVRGSLSGQEILIELDTGKSRTVVDPEFAKTYGLQANDRGYRIDEIELGTLSFTVPSAKAVSFAGISGGLPQNIIAGIGSDILSSVVLTVDYQRKQVLINRNPRDNRF